jgi:BNR/Asp-box repeat
MNDWPRCRSLASAAVVLLLAACASIPPDATGPAYVPQLPSSRDAEPFEAGGDVRVLAKDGGSFETTIAVSPQNPSQAVVGVMVQASHTVRTYATHDGGDTWTAGAPLPVDATNGRNYAAGQGDPVVVADRLGVFHFAALLTSGNPPRYTSVAALRSIDGGLTWSAPIIVAELQVRGGAERQFDDKEWLAVDDTGGRYDGHVYLLWQRISFAATPLQSRMMFARSTDRGLTWSEPVELTTPAPSGQSMLTVGPAGEVYLSYFRTSAHYIRTSTDGGETFGDPVRVPTLPWIGGNIPNTSKAMYKAFPTLLCDRSSGPHRGNLYVVIATGTTATGGARVGGVALTRSTDGGQTWSAPRMLSTPTTGDALFPGGAIDQTTGELVLAWIDRRDDPSNTLARLYATRSRDGGETFEPPAGFTPQFSIDADWIGDYYGVSGHGGKWIATFSPSSGQMSAVVLRFEQPPAGPRRRSVRK